MSDPARPSMTEHELSLVENLRHIAERDVAPGAFVRNTLRDAAAAIESAASARLIWYPMEHPPVVAEGDEVRVLVAWRIKSTGRATSGEVYYLNHVRLDWDDDVKPSDLHEDGTVSGWFDRSERHEGGAMFERLSEQFVEHLGWTPMPVMAEA